MLYNLTTGVSLYNFQNSHAFRYQNNKATMAISEGGNT